jgi:chromatin remodeling complex protein RSC6
MPRKANPALLKPLKLSADLEAVTGKGPMARGQVMKKLWEYIKAKGLQDEQNKRMINADAALLKVFGGKKQVSMFEMTKLVAAHVTDPDKKV